MYNAAYRSELAVVKASSLCSRGVVTSVTGRAAEELGSLAVSHEAH